MICPPMSFSMPFQALTDFWPRWKRNLSTCLVLLLPHFIWLVCSIKNFSKNNFNLIQLQFPNPWTSWIFLNHDVHRQVCTYSSFWNSSAARTIIFGNFSGQYELILLTTIINFYIISKQHVYFKHNFNNSAQRVSNFDKF